MAGSGLIRAAIAAPWLAAGAVVVAGAWRACGSDARELAASLQDDSFYYLLPAWRAWQTGGVLSFDGEHATFALQPAFAAVLAALAGVCPDRLTFLRAAVVFAFVAYAAVGLALAAGTRAAFASHDVDPTRARLAGALAGVVWCLDLPVLYGFTTLKENVLYALLVVWTARLAVPARDEPRRARELGAGVLLGVGLAARLLPSSLAVATVLGGAIVLGAANRTRTALRVAAGATIGWLPFAAYGLWVAGSALTTAGAVKLAPLHTALADGSYWRTLPGYAAEIPRYLLACVCYASGLPHGYFLVPQEPAPRHEAGFVIAALAAFGSAVCWRQRHRLQGVVRTLAWLAAVTLAGKALHPLLVGPFGHVGYYQWYVVVLPLLVAAAGAATALVLPARAVACGIAVLGAAAALQVLLHVRPAREFHADPDTWIRQMLVATDSANTLLPARARVAAANAGALGYFAREDLVVVNVDGLANDDWYDRQRTGMRLVDYLDHERITHVCDVLTPSGWHGNVFDRVAPVDVVPFAAPDYPGYFLLERTGERFPDFWPIGGTGRRAGSRRGPCVPWIDGDPIAAAGDGPVRALPSGRRGIWRSLRFAPGAFTAAAFHPGGGFARMSAHAGGADAELIVRSEGRELTRVATARSAWRAIDVDVADAASVHVEVAFAAAESSALWLAGIAWHAAREVVAPTKSAVLPFGHGCSSGGRAAPELSAEAPPAAGTTQRFVVRADANTAGVLSLVRHGTPVRLGALDERAPCFAWATGEPAALVPFTTGADGRATVDATLPPSASGRYVAQALLGPDGTRAGLSNGLLLLVAPSR